MKSRTSFFNETVLKKDITRFAPVWGLYTIFMLLTLFVIQANEMEPAYFASDAPSIIMIMGIVNLFYGGLCAILLYGDLFSSKMTNMLHAMPMRREGWFLTHLLSGVLFCLVPNCIGAVIAAALLQEYCYLAFVWLAVTVCQFLFFFGAGAFSVQCAGTRLGAVAVYALLNFLSVLAAFLVYTFYAPVLYGVEPDFMAMCRLSPAVGFTANYISVDYDNMTGRTVFEGFIAEDWRFLLIALGVGLVLLGISVLLYRKRAMESAGDFIAFKPASPVFLVLYTLSVGAVLYFIADQLGSGLEYLFLLIGFGIGFFTGWMLLEKKVNVFRPKRFLAFGILTVAFFFTVTLTWLDPIGITRYVPDADQVQSVSISPYASDYYRDNNSLTLTQTEDIENILAVHSDLVSNRQEGSSNLCLRIRYRLRTGAEVDRKYYLDEGNRNMEVLKKYFSDFRFVVSDYDPDYLRSHIYAAEFYSHSTEMPYIYICTPAEKEEYEYRFKDENWIYVDSLSTNALPLLLSAIEADCKAGTMAQQWEFHPTSESLGSLEIRIVTAGWTEYLSINVFDDCVNTIAFLKSFNTK